MYMFGGTDGDKLNDFWKFDLKTKQWLEIKT